MMRRWMFRIARVSIFISTAAWLGIALALATR